MVIDSVGEYLKYKYLKCCFKYVNSILYLSILYTFSQKYLYLYLKYFCMSI